LIDVLYLTIGFGEVVNKEKKSILYVLKGFVVCGFLSARLKRGKLYFLSCAGNRKVEQSFA
jgi:hypothetical protein